MVGMLSRSRDHLRERRRDGFEDDGEGAGVFERAGIVDELGGRGGRLALDLVAAELVDRLRRQAEVAHHRDAGFDHAADERHDVAAAFELHGGGAAFLEEAAGVAHGFVGVRLVAHERHVGDDDRLARSRGRRRGCDRGCRPSSRGRSIRSRGRRCRASRRRG